MFINVTVFVLTFLEVLTALLLIGIILIQQSKAGGGLGAMGGGVTETVFGATAGNVLTRGTVILASVFLCITLLLAVITGHRRVGKSVGDELAPEEAAVEAPAVPAEKSVDVDAESAPAATGEAQSSTTDTKAADSGAKESAAVTAEAKAPEKAAEGDK